MKYEVPKEQTKKLSILAVLIILLAISFYQVFTPLLIPIGLSLFFCYILLPFVESLSRRGMNRLLSISLLLFATCTVLVIVTLKVAPTLYKEVLALIRIAPSVLNQAIETWVPGIRDLLITNNLLDAETFDKFIHDIKAVSYISNRVYQGLTTVWNSAPKVLGTVVNLFLTPLLTFFLLKDWHNLKAICSRLVPLEVMSTVSTLLDRMNTALRDVLKGQMIIASLLGVMYIVGFNIIGLWAATSIGLVAGVCRLVPYFDVIIGGSLGVIVILSDFQSFSQFFYLGLVFLIIQTLDGMLITPKVIGSKSGLHPLIIILSVLTFSDLLGFWGVILAIPIIALTKVLLESCLPFYYASDFYSK